GIRRAGWRRAAVPVQRVAAMHVLKRSAFALVAAIVVVTAAGCRGPQAPASSTGTTAQDARAEVSLLVTAGAVVTMDDERRVLQPGAVAIQGRDIVAVGAPADLAARFRGAETIDAPEGIVLPGLINTHTHAAMVLYRGLADDLALMEWLEQHIFPAEAATVSPEFVRVGTTLAALEMIRSGTTTFADMYYFEEVVAEATREAGLRAVLGQTVIRFPVAD